MIVMVFFGRCSILGVERIWSQIMTTTMPTDHAQAYNYFCKGSLALNTKSHKCNVDILPFAYQLWWPRYDSHGTTMLELKQSRIINEPTDAHPI